MRLRSGLKRSFVVLLNSFPLQSVLVMGGCESYSLHSFFYVGHCLGVNETVEVYEIQSMRVSPQFPTVVVFSLPCCVDLGSGMIHDADRGILFPHHQLLF